MPLFEAYPALQRIPWVRLGDWPTPITEAKKFAKQNNLAGLYVKREDMSHAERGGNKLRGLEFLLAQAAQRNAQTLLAVGASGSQHLSRTAWHARKLGMDTTALALKQPPADYARRNLLAGLATGATYVPAGYVTLVPKLVWNWLKHNSGRGSRPVFYIPPGGTSPRSCLGHVNAAMELKRQIDDGLCPEPDYLYAAMGSMGTTAGLGLGCKLAGLKTRIVGVVVSYRWYCTPARWARLARRTLRLMRRFDPTVPDLSIEPSHLTVIGAALGKGYAHFTESSMKLAEQFHDCEGIRLDGTYTAKTLEGAMQFIHRGGLQDKIHLFWQSFQATPNIMHIPQEHPNLDFRRFFSGKINLGCSEQC